MSKAWDLYPIAADELARHAALMDLIGQGGQPGVYNSTAPASAQLPYIVLGDVNETVARRFKARSFRPDLLLHSYSDDLSTYTVLLMHRYIDEALDSKRFVLADGTRVVGGVALVSSLVDEDGVAMHAISRFSARAA